MENFKYLNQTKYIFGKGTENEVGEILKEFNAKKVLVHYGSKHAKESGLIDKVFESLKKSNIDYVELGGVKANPVDSLVRTGIELAKKEKIDFILAVGGGSVIDSSKAIGYGFYYKGDFREIFVDRAKPEKCLPIGSILTIAAAGSESSNSCVITFEEDNLKRGYANDICRPKFAIMNPELTYSLPAYQTACGITDIMAHIFERYFSPTEGSFVSQRMMEGALQSIIYDIAPTLMKDPTNYDARANIMWVSSLAHNNIFGVDRIQDWGSHKLEHELSGKYDVAHGAGLAVVFPAWMKYNYKLNLDIFYSFATRVMHIKESKNKEKVILKGIRLFKDFLHNELKMPTSFREIGAKEEDIPELVEKMFYKANKIGGLRILTPEDAKNIYKICCE